MSQGDIVKVLTLTARSLGEFTVTPVALEQC